MTLWDFNSKKTIAREGHNFESARRRDECREQLAVSGSRQSDAIWLTWTDPICRSNQSCSLLPEIIERGVQLLDSEHRTRYREYDNLTSYNFDYTRDEDKRLSKRSVYIDRNDPTNSGRASR